MERPTNPVVAEAAEHVDSSHPHSEIQRCQAHHDDEQGRRCSFLPLGHLELGTAVRDPIGQAEVDCSGMDPRELRSSTMTPLERLKKVEGLISTQRPIVWSVYEHGCQASFPS